MNPIALAHRSRPAQGPSVALAVLLSCLAPGLLAQSSEQKDAALVDAYMALADPAAQHRALATLDGEWSVAGSMRFAPDGEVEEIAATASHRPLLGGRFIVQEIHGEKNDTWPVAYAGCRIIGYDRLQECYSLVVMNNLTTASLALRGTTLDGGRTISFAGSFQEPGADRPRAYRIVYAFEDSDHFRVREYNTDASGQEFLGIEATYRRKLAAAHPLVGHWQTESEDPGLSGITLRSDHRALWHLGTAERSEEMEMLYTLDDSTRPRRIEFFGFGPGPLEGKTMYGVYRIEGERMILDLEPGEPHGIGKSVRPTGLDGASARTFVLRR